MFTKEFLKKQLSDFDIAKGKIVTVHSSLKSVGEIDGGGETLLSALIEQFTQNDGILAIAAQTWGLPVYDMRTFKTCTGILSTLAAGHQDSTRTKHPTHSLAVFGKRDRVDDFVKCDDNTDTYASPDGCYGRLFKEGGYVLLIGVGHDKNTFLHCIEEMLDVPRYLKSAVERTVINIDGTIEMRHLHPMDREDGKPDISKNFVKFEPAFRYHNCIVDGFIGNAPTQLCDARKMKEVVELIYKNNGMKELLFDDTPIDEALYK